MIKRIKKFLTPAGPIYTAVLDHTLVRGPVNIPTLELARAKEEADEAAQHPGKKKVLDINGNVAWLPLDTYIGSQENRSAYLTQKAAKVTATLQAKDIQARKKLEALNNLNGFLEFSSKLSPTLIVGGIARDLSFEDYMRQGNNGIVSDNFAELFPNVALTANIAGDFAIPLAASTSLLLKTGKSAWQTGKFILGKPAKFGNRYYLWNYTPIKKNLNMGLDPRAFSLSVTPEDVPALFTPKRWFGELGHRFDEFGNLKWNLLDEAELASHIQEYLDIVADAIRNGTMREVSQGFPGSVEIDGRHYWSGPIESWILSQSENFKRWQKLYASKFLDLGYKGGADKVGKETLPAYQANGLWFSRPKSHAERFGTDPLWAWLGFRQPYNMIGTNLRNFPMEDGIVAMLRKGNYDPRLIDRARKIWAADYLDDPAIMSIILKDPSTLSYEENLVRTQLLNDILTAQANPEVWNARLDFGDKATRVMKTTKLAGGSAEKYDGIIGYDHTLGYTVPKGTKLSTYDPSEVLKGVDYRPAYGANPISLVITLPEQAKSVIGNSGGFSGASYMRKTGGKLIKKRF